MSTWSSLFSASYTWSGGLNGSWTRKKSKKSESNVTGLKQNKNDRLTAQTQPGLVTVFLTALSLPSLPYALARPGDGNRKESRKFPTAEGGRQSGIKGRTCTKIDMDVDKWFLDTDIDISGLRMMTVLKAYQGAMKIRRRGPHPRQGRADRPSTPLERHPEGLQGRKTSGTERIFEKDPGGSPDVLPDHPKDAQLRRPV